jgi:hypothetical protein
VPRPDPAAGQVALTDRALVVISLDSMPMEMMRVVFGVVTKRRRHHVRLPVRADGRDPAQALPGEVLKLGVGEHAHDVLRSLIFSSARSPPGALIRALRLARGQAPSLLSPGGTAPLWRLMLITGAWHG